MGTQSGKSPKVRSNHALVPQHNLQSMVDRIPYQYSEAPMASNTSFQDRLSTFRQNFSKLMQSGGQLVGRKNAGYEELSQGLMDNSEHGDTDSGFRPGQTAGTYQGPLPGFESGPTTDAQLAAAYGTGQGHVPSQVRLQRENAELVLLHPTAHSSPLARVHGSLSPYALHAFVERRA